MKYIGVILVGGKGSRLKDLTKKTPKPLLQINQKNFFDSLIYKICEYNFKKIYLICSYKSEQFIKKYHGAIIFGVEIICIKEKYPKDTGGALFEIKKKINKDFFLFNGDSFFSIDLNFFYKFAKKNNKMITVACCKNNSYKSNKKLSNLILKKNIISFTSKKTSIMNGGVYFIKKNIFKIINNKKISLENEILKKLILKKKVAGKIFSNFFIDIGIKKNLKKARKVLDKHTKLKAFFLDRDGVINKDNGYVYKIKDFQILPGVIKGIKLLNQKKFLVIIITNQSGIGRGYYKLAQFQNLNQHLSKLLIKNKSIIDDVFFCPHHPTEAKGVYKRVCNCRKPNSGMILQAINKWNIEIKKSYFIGDKLSDEKAANKAKVKFFYKNNKPLNQQIIDII